MTLMKKWGNDSNSEKYLRVPVQFRNDMIRVLLLDSVHRFLWFRSAQYLDPRWQPRETEALGTQEELSYLGLPNCFQ